MIGRLRGIVAERGPDRCLLDVNGVGYEVLVSLQSLATLPAVGEEATLHIHTHVREDQIALFGFTSEAERQLFLLLLGVNGVGPKVALTVLGLPVGELVRAIADQQVRRLTQVQGVGKKLAERIVLELREKVGKLPLTPGEMSATAGLTARTGRALPNAPLAGQPAILGDVASVLVNLGFRREQAEMAALALAGRESEGLDALVRAALRHLGGAAGGAVGA